MDNTDYRITLDITDMSAPISLNVKQGDAGRIIEVHLSREGVPVAIESGSYAVFAGKKPDGKVLWNSCTIQDNRILYEITKQTTAVVGWVPVQIRLYRPGGKLVTSPDFVLIVDGTVTEDDEIIIISENEVTALTELVSEARDVIDLAGKVEGKSAYQVAVDNGFEGTEEEWLESLVGRPGKTGPKGDSTTISLRYGISSEPMENTVVVWQDTIPQMSETYPYLWIEISTETTTSTGGSIVIEKGIIGYYSVPNSGGNENQGGTGLSETASNALITLLKNASYVRVDMYPELKTLADELGVELTDYIPATGITLSESALSFTTEDTQTIVAILTPDNASDPVVWSSSDDAVATVSGGVVTPVASGDCIITATAGNVSAKCRVNVKLLGMPIYTLKDLTRTFKADTDYFSTTSNNHLKIVTTSASVYGISNADTYTDGANPAAGKGANPATEWFTIPAGATCEFYVLNGTGSGDLASESSNAYIRLVLANGSNWSGDVAAGLEVKCSSFITGAKTVVTVEQDTVVGALAAKLYATGEVEGDLVLTVNGVRYL